MEINKIWHTKLWVKKLTFCHKCDLCHNFDLQKHFSLFHVVGIDFHLLWLHCCMLYFCFKYNFCEQTYKQIKTKQWTHAQNKTRGLPSHPLHFQSDSQVQISWASGCKMFCTCHHLDFSPQNFLLLLTFFFCQFWVVQHHQTPHRVDSLHQIKQEAIHDLKWWL